MRHVLAASALLVAMLACEPAPTVTPSCETPTEPTYTDSPTPGPTYTALPSQTAYPTEEWPTPQATYTPLPTSTLLPTDTPQPEQVTYTPAATFTPLATSTSYPTQTPRPIQATYTPAVTYTRLPTLTPRATYTRLPTSTAYPTHTPRAVQPTYTPFPAQCTPDETHFCPDDPYTRAEAAAFALQLAHGTSYQPPSGTYCDDTSEHAYRDWIARAILEELAPSCVDGLFHPDWPMTRAQWAAILYLGVIE